jgi:hypothetical protein
MIPVILISLASTILAVLAFCLAWQPSVWIQIWGPHHRLYRATRPEHQHLLRGVRIRSALAGVTMLTLAMILPVAVMTYFNGPATALGEAALPITTPQLPPDQQYIPDAMPRESIIPTARPDNLGERLWGPQGRSAGPLAVGE